MKLSYVTRLYFPLLAETSISLLVHGRPQYKLLLHFNAFDFSHSQEGLLCMCVFSLRTVNSVRCLEVEYVAVGYILF